MGEPPRSFRENSLFQDYDYKGDESDADDEGDDYDGSVGAYDEYHQNDIQEDDDVVVQHNYEEDGFSDEVPSSAHDDSRGHADAESEDGHDSSNTISEKDEHRLLGAFLLASDGGLDGGGGREGGEEQEPRLPTHAPTCLQKFTTIAASLGLKTTREKLREDFEEVVRSNRLARTSPGDPWQGAHDASRPIVGFTYKVFRRYYLAKIQGVLLEANIRRAWEDLHHGTGGKLYQPGYSTADLGATAAAASPSTLPRGGKGKTAPNREQQQHHHHHQHHHRRGSEDRHHHGRPYMLRAELHKILTTDGEALTDEEVDELLRECRPDQEGRIVYEGYRRMLIDPSL